MRGIDFQFPLGVSAAAGLWLALALGGCASTESENMSERPWNTPQSWENGLPSGMYQPIPVADSAGFAVRELLSYGSQLDPTRRRKDAVQAHVMGSDGNLSHDLLVERHSTRCPAQCPQQLVVVSLAPAQPATVQVKGHAGNQDQIQPA